MDIDNAEIQHQQKRRARSVTFLLLAAPTFLYLLMLIAPLIVTVVISFGERASAGGYVFLLLPLSSTASWPLGLRHFQIPLGWPP